MLNNTKLRHFWAQIVSLAPRHARKTFIVLAQGSLRFYGYDVELCAVDWSSGSSTGIQAVISAMLLMNFNMCGNSYDVTNCFISSS